MAEMTSRQRLLATYDGLETDRIAFWAKVANPTWRSSQPPNVQIWSDRELLDYIEADGIFGCPHGVRIVRPHVDMPRIEKNHLRTVVTSTPDGTLKERWQLDPCTNSWHPIEFPVKTLEDIRLWRWVYRDIRAEPDERSKEASRQRVEDIGERGITKSSWGTSPLMNLVEHIIGPVNTHLFLHDYPEAMEELMEIMHRAACTTVRGAATHTAADLLASVENTSTTLISPGQFRTYCLPHLRDYGKIIQEAGKRHELHMCGKTLALLEEIDTIPADSIEAFTSPGLGDTRLCDGRSRAPSKTLVGGTNVNVWLWPIERIQQYILDELQACEDRRRIVLTTAGVAPPGCPAEQFRAIGQWLRGVAA